MPRTARIAPGEVIFHVLNLYRTRFPGHSSTQLRCLPNLSIGPRLGRRAMPEPLDEPCGVVPLDELADDRPGLLQSLEPMQVETLLLQRENSGDTILNS